MNATSNQMAALGEAIEKQIAGSSVKLTGFPSGGAMLDVRRDGRLFVMSYTPDQGFGVDEVQAEDGFVRGYQFAATDFEVAAEQLHGLVSAEQPSSLGVGLNLVVIFSRDIEAAKDFYSCLGATFQREKHGAGPEHYAAQLGATVLEIYPCRDDSPSATRLGFRLPSVDRTLELLRRQNAVVHTSPTTSPRGRRAVVEDPDGNKVELVEAAKNSQTPLPNESGAGA